MGKTSYKREAARIRQRERRRKKAEQERSSSPQDAELTTTNKAPSEDEADTFAAAFLLATNAQSRVSAFPQAAGGHSSSRPCIPRYSSMNRHRSNLVKRIGIRMKYSGI
ncbi:hypothetical protein LB503_007883 [Fusarium chuoi]|nr:hypothetical protein LB503_007883 [Fusarium chuoi]